MTLRARAPAKVNLCLFVGTPREDGLHPLVSVVQALSLADELTLEPAERDEVVCPGVEGPNLAGRALHCSASTTGWDGPPQRLTIDKRIPVAAGMGGGSSDAAATLRLAAHAAGLPMPAELGPRLGADVPSLLRPGRVLMTGAGEHVDRLPDPEPLGVLVLPADAALSTPDVYREADRLGLTRPHAALDRGRRARSPQRPPGRRPLALPRDRRRARHRPRGRRRPRDRLRLRADRRRPVPRRGRPGPRAEGARRLAARVRRRAGRRGVGGRQLMHPFPLAGAIGLAVFLVVRRQHLGRATLAVGAVVVAALALWGFGVVEPPNLTKLIEDVGNRLGKWTYLLVGALAFLETGAFVGLVAPGESAILIGGVVAGQGQISIYVLIGIVWACAVAGDLTSYTLGRRLGRGFLERHGPRLKITEERLRYVEDFFARRGGITILIGRFIGLVRAIAPFIAGASKMPLRTFLPYDVLGAGLWASLFCLLGYFFWQSLDKVEAYIGKGAAAFSGLVVVGLAIWFAVRYRRDDDVPRQGPAPARAQPRVAARPRPADVRRRPRHLRPRARHAARRSPRSAPTCSSASRR